MSEQTENFSSEASTENQSTQQTAETTQPPEQSQPETPPSSLLESMTEEEQDDEGKTAEAETDDSQESEKKDADKADEGAPEQYEEFKAPEGVALDADVIKAYSEVAKELNLSQDKAQSVIDKLTPIIAQRQAQQYLEAKKKWAERTMSDPVIGGENWKKTRASAHLALREFCDEKGQFKDADIAELAASAGDHPGLIKLFAHFGASLKEDRGVKQKAEKGKTVYTAEDFYRQREE